MFKTLSVGCVCNTMIVHNGSEAMAQQILNYWSSVLLTVRSHHMCDFSQSPWQELFIYKQVFNAAV
jgi:hypothetical protein